MSCKESQMWGPRVQYSYWSGERKCCAADSTRTLVAENVPNECQASTIHFVTYGFYKLPKNMATTLRGSQPRRYSP